MARTTKPRSSSEPSEPDQPDGDIGASDPSVRSEPTRKISPPKSAVNGDADSIPTQVLPTEQLASAGGGGEPGITVAATKDAGSYAAGNDTAGNDTAGGTDGRATDQRSFVRRHPVGLTLVGAAIAVVLASAITAWGVGAAVTSSLTSATTPATTASTASSATGGTGGGTGGAAASLGGRNRLAGEIVVRATIDSIDGSTWSVTTRRGQAATVTIDSATQFGTKRAPASASSFAVGDAVVIFATRSSTTSTTGSVIRITAARQAER